VLDEVVVVVLVDVVVVSSILELLGTTMTNRGIDVGEEYIVERSRGLVSVHIQPENKINAIRTKGSATFILVD
jgi:hypothetical protein